MTTHSGILAWKIPWTKEPPGLQSMVLQRVRHDWVTKALEKQMEKWWYLEPFVVFSSFNTWCQVSKLNFHCLKKLLWNKIHILGKDKKDLNTKVFSAFWPPLSPHYTLHICTMHQPPLPHWQKYQLNHKEQHSPSVNHLLKDHISSEFCKKSHDPPWWHLDLGCVNCQWYLI